MDALGGRCAQCAFSDYRALHVDHVNGGGAEERRNGVGGAALYNRILQGVAGYQLLCANCNAIKRHELGEHVGKRVYVRTIPPEPRVNRRWTPEQRAVQSARTKAYYADPAARAKRSAASREMWNNPAIRESITEAASERMKARWASGEVPNRPKDS